MRRWTRRSVLGGGDPHLALLRSARVRRRAAARTRGVCGSSSDSTSSSSTTGNLADLGPHPVGFGQFQRQDRQALLAARAVGVQVDAVEHEGEIVAVRPDQADSLVDLARGQLRLALAETSARSSARVTARFESVLARGRAIHHLQCLQMCPPDREKCCDARARRSARSMHSRCVQDLDAPARASARSTARARSAGWRRSRTRRSTWLRCSRTRL